MVLAMLAMLHPAVWNQFALFSKCKHNVNHVKVGVKPQNFFLPDQSLNNMRVHFIRNLTVANEKILRKRKNLVLLLGNHTPIFSFSSNV